LRPLALFLRGLQHSGGSPSNQQKWNSIHELSRLKQLSESQALISPSQKTEGEDAMLLGRTVLKLCLILAVSVCLAATAIAQSKKESTEGRSPASWAAPDGRVRFVKAFVVDDRLSPLRREPRTKAEIIQRLRLGRSLYILETRKATAEEPAFLRVAATRRTRGWIHHAAIAVPSRSAEDARVIALIVASRDGLDRITLCKLFLERFAGSRLAPRALLLMAEEADRAAANLARGAHRRIGDSEGQPVSQNDLYLNDPGLDRYSRLRISFDFDETTGRYAYDGRAYREILRRFPRSPEAVQARSRLESRADTPAPLGQESPP
jgi:hypothetical protein